MKVEFPPEAIVPTDLVIVRLPACHTAPPLPGTLSPSMRAALPGAEPIGVRPTGTASLSSTACAVAPASDVLTV